MMPTNDELTDAALKRTKATNEAFDLLYAALGSPIVHNREINSDEGLSALHAAVSAGKILAIALVDIQYNLARIAEAMERDLDAEVNSEVERRTREAMAAATQRSFIGKKPN